MKHASALLLCFVIAGCQFSKDSENKLSGPDAASTLTVEQKAALELGYFYGSRINLISLPDPLRAKSFAGIEYNKDDLSRLFEKLNIVKTAADGFVSLTDQAMAEGNPIEASKKLLDVVNAIKTTLSLVFPESTGQPQIWRVYRIGYSLGYQFELAAITSTGNPTRQNLTTFTGLSQKVRISLPEDLANSKLPDDIESLIKDTNMEANTTEDLDSIVKTSLELYDLIRSEK